MKPFSASGLDRIIKKEDNRPVSVDVNCTVYNHGEYLEQALNGILMQETDFPVRIVIHDDASTDNSAEIIRDYQAKYPDRIVAVIEEKNLCQNGKSIGLKMAPYYTAKYIAFCEGDDFWTDPHKLQMQVDYLEQNPDCMAVYHNVLPVDRYGQYDESLRGIYPELPEGDYTDREIHDFKLKTQMASAVTRNYYPWLSDTQKEIVFRTKVNGDAKKLMVCASFGRIHYLPNVMAAHRRVLDSGDSWTARQARKSELERFVGSQKTHLALCRFYEFCFGTRRYPYNDMLDARVSFFRNTKTDRHDPKVKDKLKEIPIPFYARLLYVPRFLLRIAKFGCRKLRLTTCEEGFTDR